MHPELPFFLSWTKKYLYIIFGVCEIYICRIGLSSSLVPVDRENVADDSANDSEDEDEDEDEDRLPRRRVEYLREPVFLPASTAERKFTFHAQRVWDRDYVVFGLAAHQNLPAAIVWKDVEKDLGGWAEYDGTHLGMTYEDELDNMQGTYSCSGSSFGMQIRSGLAWNKRKVVTCGTVWSAPN